MKNRFLLTVLLIAALFMLGACSMRGNSSAEPPSNQSAVQTDNASQEAMILTKANSMRWASLDSNTRTGPGGGIVFKDEPGHRRGYCMVRTGRDRLESYQDLKSYQVFGVLDDGRIVFNAAFMNGGTPQGRSNLLFLADDQNQWGIHQPPAENDWLTHLGGNLYVSQRAPADANNCFSVAIPAQSAALAQNRAQAAP